MAGILGNTQNLTSASILHFAHCMANTVLCCVGTIPCDKIGKMTT